MFLPDKEATKPDLLATTGDHLRIWRINEDSVVLDAILTNVSTCHSYTCSQQPTAVPLQPAALRCVLGVHDHILCASCQLYWLMLECGLAAVPPTVPSSSAVC